MVQPRVKGRRPGSVVGDTAGGRLRREVRALARHEGQGDPAREVPRPVRAGRLPDPELGGVPRALDARGVRATDAGDAGAGGCRALRPEPGTDLGLVFSRGRDRSPGEDADSGTSARIRRAGNRGARSRRHRPGRAVEPGRMGGTGPARGELAPRGRRGLAGIGTTGTTRTTTSTEPRRERKLDRTTTTSHGTHWTMCSSSTGMMEGHSTHFLAGRPDLHLPPDRLVEGLQMAHSFEHIPVLRDEVVSLYASVPPGILLDATVGGGGHAAALLEAYPGLRVVGLDR